MVSQQPVNLIRLFDFYLALMFLLSFLRRWRIYLNAFILGIAINNRWPRLVAQISRHRELVLSWAVLRPTMIALVLVVIQIIASRLIWPQAQLTISDLRTEWWLGIILLVAFLPMLAVDVYFIVRVNRFDRDETIRYLDQAETWLGWKGQTVRVLTLGFVNPVRIVDDEVRKGLSEMQTTIAASLWWVITQMGLRIGFGLTLWASWLLRLAF